jgi:hypothetical protein
MIGEDKDTKLLERSKQLVCKYYKKVIGSLPQSANSPTQRTKMFLHQYANQILEVDLEVDFMS